MYLKVGVVASSSLLVGANFCESVVVVVILLVPLKGSLQLAFIILSGSEKSISDIAANATLLKEGGNQEHGIDVQNKDFCLSISLKSEKNCCNVGTCFT